MMFDVANGDEMFGYIHTDTSGRIASIGTLCKIVDRQLLEDGRQLIALEGVSRFKVIKILKTLPYVLGEVEVFAADDEPEDEIATTKLESEVWSGLKYYLRLMKSYGPNKELVVSQAAKRNRPSLASMLSASDNHQRRTNFSFSLANMIQMAGSRESQLLLQTTDINKRIKAEKDIITQAADIISKQLIEMDTITADARDKLKFDSYNSDTEDDILPGDVIEVEKESDKDEWDISNIM